MYQAWLDGDRDISLIPKEEDPFWEPVEDTLIGTANIFLQSLGYALDFEDCLTITDFKGHEEGTLNVHVAPCSAAGRPLGEEHYIDDPRDLLDGPYHFKVWIQLNVFPHFCYRCVSFVNFRNELNTSFGALKVVMYTTYC
jgi:kinesin family member 1